MSYSIEKTSELVSYAKEINFKIKFDEECDWNTAHCVFAIYNSDRTKVYIGHTESFYTRYLSYLYIDKDRGLDEYLKQIIYDGTIELLEISESYGALVDLEKTYLKKFIEQKGVEVINKGAKQRVKKMDIKLPNVEELYEGLDYYPNFAQFGYNYYMGLNDFVKNFPLVIGRNTFYGFLRGKDILRVDSAPNVEYVRDGYFAVTCGEIRGNEYIKSYLTELGVEWLKEQCKQWGLLKGE